MVFPVKGKVIREYTKGTNDGIDMSGNAGGPVVAAASGKVAAITADADQIPIMVIKHPDNVLTVYANVHNITVAKGDNVSRGQQIAELARKAPVSASTAPASPNCSMPSSVLACVQIRAAP